MGIVNYIGYKSNQKFMNGEISYPSRFPTEHNRVYLPLVEGALFNVCF